MLTTTNVRYRLFLCVILVIIMIICLGESLLSILKKLKQILNWWTFIFLGLGFLSVYVISSYTRQSIVCILSKPEVQAVLIVALPTLVIWNIDLSARRNENFNSITESTLSLRKSFEERFFKTEDDIKKILSDKSDSVIKRSELSRILSTLAGDLDYLEELLESRDEVMFQRIYLLEIFHLLAIVETKDGEKNGELLKDRIRYIKTKILNYYLSIINKRTDFEVDIIYELLINLNEDGNNEVEENGEGEFVIRNIDFCNLPINDRINSIKDKTYLKFINCRINIDTIKYLIKEDSRTVEFKKCEIIKKGFRNRKLVMSKKELCNLLSIQKVIIN